MALNSRSSCLHLPSNLITWISGVYLCVCVCVSTWVFYMPLLYPHPSSALGLTKYNMNAVATELPVSVPSRFTMKSQVLLCSHSFNEKLTKCTLHIHRFNQTWIKYIWLKKWHLFWTGWDFIIIPSTIQPNNYLHSI
jgi:hypothetical protein